MTGRIRAFLVDDDPDYREFMARVLSKQPYELEIFDSGAGVLEAVKTREFDIGLVDMQMPMMSGIALIRELKARNVPAEIIVLTAQADVPTAVEAMKLGCFDYLTKFVQLETLETVIRKAFEKKTAQKENIVLREGLQLKDKYCDMVGKSPKIRAVFELIDKVARTDSLVLVLGESGTGKELVARAIHRISGRVNKPFIIIDCASLSETLLENELFGHEKGAFTDATSLKRGLLEVADGGTLFIDEIGEMKPSTQSKLLRVIETHQFRRLGSTQQIKINVRIVAATNRNLQEEVKKGNFREDLFYRLNVVTINLPPLRERREDIPLLARYFIANSQVSSTKKRIREEDLKLLVDYDWPGNVRELANVVERALVVSANEYITPADLPAHLAAGSGAASAVAGRKKLADMINEFEKQIIVTMLQECGGNRIEAARMLGISRAKLYRKLDKFDIEGV